MGWKKGCILQPKLQNTTIDVGVQLLWIFEKYFKIKNLFLGRTSYLLYFTTLDLISSDHSRAIWSAGGASNSFWLWGSGAYWIDGSRIIMLYILYIVVFWCDGFDGRLAWTFGSNAMRVILSIWLLLWCSLCVHSCALRSLPTVHCYVAHCIRILSPGPPFLFEKSYQLSIAQSLKCYRRSIKLGGADLHDMCSFFHETLLACSPLCTPIV